jgi:ribosomal protein S12 methylthiotransferase accessory factor
MKLAHHLSATKREVQGEASLNEIDRQHIDRYTQLDVAASMLLHPMVPSNLVCGVSSYNKIGRLTAIRQRLDAVGVDVYAMNLTRPALGISVTRAAAPAQPVGLGAPPCERLHAVTVRSGVDLASPIMV